MAQTYTLEEAADKLDLSLEEFKRRLRTEWTQVRSFRDGSTLRFRANEIEELARSIGLGSSEELPLADSGNLDIPDEIGLAAEAPRTPPPAKKKSGDSDAPLKLDDSDELFLLAPDDPKSGKKAKTGSDSDVRLEKSAPKKSSLSEDEESILTDEFELASASSGGSGKLSGKSGKLSAKDLKSGDSGKAKAKPAADDSSSEFELSLEADSDEFELSVTPDSSEEVSLGELPEPKNKGGQSGINLGRPADSGVSLEKKKQKAAADDDEIDFELSLDAPGSGASSKKKHGSARKMEADSDSEFELTLEEPSDLALDTAAGGKKGDIFEATDFEIPALEDDSASEAVSLDEADTDLESSDFDLAIDEDDAAADDDDSKSEVVELDEDDVKSQRKKVKKKKARAADDDDDSEVDLGDVDVDDDEDAGEALVGVESDDDDEDRPVASEYGPAKWGALPAVLMAPTFLILFLGGLMAYELLHSAWGAQQSTKATTPLVSWMAETAGMKPTQ